MYTPKYTITNRILRNIGIIEAAREVINTAPLLPYYEKQFRENAMVRSVHHGTHIEGNELNLDQAEQVLQGEDIIARERDIQEVLNYRKVMEFIGELGDREKDMVTIDLFKKLHKLTVNKILPDGKVGEIRKTQVVIKNSRTGDVSFKPPAASEITRQLNDFIVFINGSSQKDIHPVLKAAIVHYEFVRIHHFLDGNGRVGRALSTFILFSEDYDIRKFFSLEEYFDKNASEYYRTLQQVQKDNYDLTSWLEYFTEGLAIELSKIKTKVEKISIDGRIKQKLGGKPVLLSDRQLKIIEYIQEAGFLQNKAFSSLFPMVSEDTVLNEVNSLIKSGILKKQGATKGAKYIMS